jgi:DnaJ-domain-containing protein 1
MTDNFALLNEPRRPWIDPDLLKKKFLALSTNTHPDKIHPANENEKNATAKKFADLNAAYNCLLEPKSRLLHLIELELGVKPKDIQLIPAALADLFAEIAAVCKSADNFLAEKNKATSPLLQVQLFERAQEWIEKLNLLQTKFSGLRGKLKDELKSLDDKWIENDLKTRGDLLKKLEELYRLFGYFNRWNNQIQERVVQLSL